MDDKYTTISPDSPLGQMLEKFKGFDASKLTPAYPTFDYQAITRQMQESIQNIEVDSANELTVRDLRLDTGAAVRLFVDAGLSVSDAHLYEDTLEDYFKQVTGGEGIA